MNFEIEFHPVGDGSKAGDAISVRYGSDGDYKVIIIDGGTDDSGERIVQHVKSVYGPRTIVSDVVNTHPDSDHACGLREVLRELPVERLWIHGVWHHTASITNLFADPRWTEDGLAKAIRSEYPVIVDLFDLAAKKGVPIYEPFAGTKIGPFTVLSPNKPTYEHLIPQFRKTPEPDVELLKQRGIWLGDGQKLGMFAALLEKAATTVASWIPEKWDIELLKEGGITAAENESSTVLFGDFDSIKILLTADAGVNALRWAAEYATSIGLDIKSAELVQVPHHGSRRNVAPSVLNRIVGPKLPTGTVATKRAIVSAPKDDANHPRKMVLNAFLRRGAPVRSTQGSRYRFHYGMPGRPNEAAAEIFGFFDKVEAYD
jgi:beta-lactamase superfamily II metal-dependent hydrolase